MIPPEIPSQERPESEAARFGRVAEALSAGVLFVYALPIIILFFVLWLESRQRARCPASTFLFGSAPTVSWIVLKIWVGIPIAALLMAFGAGLLFRAITGRKVGRVSDLFLRVSKWSLVVLLLLMIAGTATASRAQYCLAPEGILLREQPWTDLAFHEWRDVARIDTWCSRAGRNGFVAPYVLTLATGETFDIAASPKSFVQSFPHLSEQLHDMPFQFRRGPFVSRCTVAHLALLQKKP